MSYVLYVLMGLTVLSLLAGLFCFVRPSQAARFQSNKIMQARVLFQAAALLCLAVLLMR
ncbi:MAG: twin transmembrane helix small protein [Alphaproteobacteria bacterium]